jgi:ZIP family zinc transporter
MIPEWLKAGLWGLLAGSALIIGALVGYFSKINQRWIAVIMSFGSGVLIYALSFVVIDLS